MTAPDVPARPAATAVRDRAPAPAASEQAKARYFLMCGNQRRGPLTPRQMVDLGLTAASVVWREGLDGWKRARDVPELAKLVGLLPPVPAPSTQPPAVVVPSPDRKPQPATPSRAQRYAASAVHGAVHGAGQVFGSFARLDLKREVWPLDGPAARTMAADPAFWCVSLLAALPLLFCSFGNADQSLTAFSLFFSGVWALIFCYVVKGEQVGWGWRVGCMLFTGTLGIAGCQLAYDWSPAWYGGLIHSPTFFLRTVGYVGQVGVLEEATKAVPVAALAVLLRRRLLRVDVVLLGVFSGLGFAAFENLHYFHGQLTQNVSGAADTLSAVSGSRLSGDDAARTLTDSAYLTMLMPLTRSLSSPFGHAVWSGVLAHFVAAAVRPEAKGRHIALVACGWGLAALLHGLYDVLQEVQLALAAGVAVLAFMLLRMYLAGVEEQSATMSIPAVAPSSASDSTEVALG